MINILKPLAKRVLIPLELTAAASATETAIHKKIFGSGWQYQSFLMKKWMISWKKLSHLNNLLY